MSKRLDLLIATGLTGLVLTGGIVLAMPDSQPSGWGGAGSVQSISISLGAGQSVNGETEIDQQSADSVDSIAAPEPEEIIEPVPEPEPEPEEVAEDQPQSEPIQEPEPVVEPEPEPEPIPEPVVEPAPELEPEPEPEPEPDCDDDDDGAENERKCAATAAAFDFTVFGAGVCIGLVGHVDPPSICECSGSTGLAMEWFPATMRIWAKFRSRGFPAHAAPGMRIPSDPKAPERVLCTTSEPPRRRRFRR